jgi:glucose/arabinose dehydrogenase
MTRVRPIPETSPDRGTLSWMMASSRVRLAGAALAFILAAACASSDPDLEGRRVIATPRPSNAVDTTVSPPAASADAAISTPGGSRAPARTDPPPPPPGSLARAATKLTRVAVLDQPLAMALRRGDDAIYIVEKGGRIRSMRNGRVSETVVLDISNQVSSGGEQGLLGAAFHPDGSRLYVNFTNTLGDTIVREYSFSGGRAVNASACNELEVDQPYPNHNGGNLVFGPDGYLYIGLGDGGSGGDPQQNAQNLNSLLGKMLRIDPRPSCPNAYRVPSDNPFVGREGARPEIWSYGWRNPWRYTFDRSTGDMWVGDVGQNAWEEVDFEDASNNGGDNYGWDRLEGSHRHEGSAPARHHGPIYEYANGSDNCAVTGGYVYRGSRNANLRGAYLFADFCAGRLRAFVENGGKATEHRFLGPQVASLASFGQDQAGELYVLSLEGGVYRIDPA